MSQTERILFIDNRIRNNGHVTVKETAEYFEVSTRQIKRDIEYLRNRFNAPIVYKKSLPGYYYERVYKDLAFADQNLLLYYITIKSLSNNQHYIPVYSDEMIKTVANDVPKNYLDVCSKITYQMPQFELANPDCFMAVCNSIRTKKCLQIEYINLKEEHSVRCVEPEHVINYAGSWYLICFDHKHNDIRTFHFSRIKAVSESNNSFTNHDVNYQDEVTNYINGTFGIFKGKSNKSVKIRFTNTAARIVETQTWHPNQILKHSKIPEKYIELTFPVANYTEVLSKILSFGANACPISPPELVQIWKEEIAKMQRLTE